jgi:hypothetical protein
MPTIDNTRVRAMRDLKGGRVHLDELVVAQKLSRELRVHVTLPGGARCVAITGCGQAGCAGAIHALPVYPRPSRGPGLGTGRGAGPQEARYDSLLLPAGSGDANGTRPMQITDGSCSVVMLSLLPQLPDLSKSFPHSPVDCHGFSRAANVF